MATRTSEARARVTLDSSNFEKGAAAIKKAAQSMSSTVSSAFKIAGGAIAAYAGIKSVGAILETIDSILDLGENMANAGHKAQIAAGQFYLFNNAVEKGLSLGTVGKLIGENAQVLNRSANLFRDVSIKLWVVGEKIRGFWLGLVERLAPVLSKLLDGALAANLVSAGQAFGESIANAFKVIYQLAEDGQLWGKLKEGFEIAFKYAGERLNWLAGIGFDVLKFMFSESLLAGVEDGLKAAWKEVEIFAKSFGDAMGSAFVSFFVDIQTIMNAMLAKVDQLMARLHLISQAEADANTYNRENNSFIPTDAKGGYAGSSKTPVENISEAIERIMTRNGTGEFKQSDDLAAMIEKFTTSIPEVLSKYNSGLAANPPTTYENNSRRPTFGADSLAAIGAGGGVSLGLSVLDIQKSQLRVQEQMLEALTGRQALADYANKYLRSAPDSVTRTQTNSPIASN